MAKEIRVNCRKPHFALVFYDGYHQRRKFGLDKNKFRRKAKAPIPQPSQTHKLLERFSQTQIFILCKEENFLKTARL